MSSAVRGPETATVPLAVFHVDLESALGSLEAEEARTIRLSPVERARFDQKLSALGERDARSWRAAHVALRIALERATGDALRGVAFDIEPGGRPCIPQSAALTNYPDFSLAHAGSDALIAISLNGPVGIDIEVPRQLTISAERRSRIERAAKNLAPAAPLPGDPNARLLQAWVRLEAVAKATGLGIGRILTEAGIIGASSEAATAGHATAFPVVDLTAGAERFAAVSARRLPQIVMVQEFPATPAALAAFLAPRAKINTSKNR